MLNLISKPELKIIGLEIRTTNENSQCVQDIFLLWKQFMQEEILEQIPNKISNEIVSVYTNYENEGKNCQGKYSVILGTWVSSFDSMPKNFAKAIIQPACYSVFSVNPPSPEAVGKTWQSIWQTPPNECPRTFLADFDLYDASGKISVWVGVRSYQ